MAVFSRQPAAPTARELRRERHAFMHLREERLRDLGGLTLEMYRRDEFNPAAIVERCSELVAIETRVSEIDALLAAARGIRSRAGTICACGAPILIGARYCPSCGRDVVEGDGPPAA